MVQDRAILRPTMAENQMWLFEWRYFHWPGTTPNQDFKATPFVDAEYLRNDTRYWHSYNGI